MNGVKKSDGAILPSKRANKGTGVPAEPVEGRASAKGNPRSESTRRTQSRGSVTQAAGRIRQAATRKPQEKLTALLHHVTPDALRWAFHALKRDCGATINLRLRIASFKNVPEFSDRCLTKMFLSRS